MYRVITIGNYTVIICNYTVHHVNAISNYPTQTCNYNKKDRNNTDQVSTDGPKAEVANGLAVAFGGTIAGVVDRLITLAAAFFRLCVCVCV